jgi:hypothetical protein
MDAYAALRVHVPELPALPSREELRLSLAIGEALLREPLWSDQTGLSDGWQRVRCELANQRYERRKSRAPMSRPVSVDANVRDALDEFIADLPAPARAAVRALSETKMPIDRWIELARIAEDLYAELSEEERAAAASAAAAPSEPDRGAERPAVAPK